MCRFSNADVNQGKGLDRNVRFEPEKKRNQKARGVLGRHQAARADENNAQPNQDRRPVFQKESHLDVGVFCIDHLQPTICNLQFVSMTKADLTQPLVFQPIFMETVLGRRRLESLYGKRLPRRCGSASRGKLSIDPRRRASCTMAFSRRTLHDLWINHRKEVFGAAPDAPRFPILAKLLDAQENLSLQVHPPAAIAQELGGEPKSEFWYIADAAPKAEIFAGLKKSSTRGAFVKALKQGKVESHAHQIFVASGDAIFLPSGRLHAVGAGNLIVEIQQNSDTTIGLRLGPREERWH